MYFVVYTGDLELDPLDKGVEVFEQMSDMYLFCGRMRNKGYIARMYKGSLVETLEDKMNRGE